MHMENLQQEADFFHFIAKAVQKFVSDKDNDVSIVKHKREGDFSTLIDVGVENLIVKEIKKRFPEDLILAEEGYHNTKFSEKRAWIIDPICGTNNLARGIKNFCTNIALADKNTLIASCVIDHSQNDYCWSIGNKQVYLNTVLFQQNQKRFDVVIEVDFGSVLSVEKDQREKHNRFLKKLITDTNYYLISLNSSLGFAYTAIGKVDGFFNIYNNPWDISASSFLIQQSGGIITDLAGKPWTLTATGAIAAREKNIHKKLLDTYLTS